MLLKENDITFAQCWFVATECEDKTFIVNRCRLSKGDIVHGEQHKQRLWNDLNNRPGTNFYFYLALAPVYLDPDFTPF